MRRQMLLVAFAASAVAGAAIAQTNAPATNSTANPPASTTAPSLAPSSSTQGGMQMAQSATTVIRYVTVAPADVLSSRLIGTNVYNNQNETIGEIEDLVVENGKTIKAVVIGVGGFLGIGERYVAVDPSTVFLTRRDNDTLRAMVDTNKDNLKNAPAFNYSKRNR